jgi:ATP-dependent DNA ligase
VILDGEGVICGPDGVSDFDRMRGMFSRKGSSDVFLYAFDVLELDGRDLRAQRWDERRSLLTQLLDRCPDGIRLSEHVADADGAAVFQQACVMGLEGIVAKRRDSRYRSGRCREWIKVKNRAHPAFERAMPIAAELEARGHTSRLNQYGRRRPEVWRWHAPVRPSRAR